MKRTAKQVVKGFRTQDGAGVSLVRVLGNQTAEAFDPFLMLDSFDSTNYDDWRAGFPLHPHRGIETVSYIHSGGMHHRDTMGFEDEVHDGEVQWMCAGSGVEHEETIPPAPRLAGLQLWLNLPAKDKMAQPTYTAIHREDIESIALDGVELRLLAGSFTDQDGNVHTGHQGDHVQLNYYELNMVPGAKVELPTPVDKTVMAFTLLGGATIGELPVGEKSAVLLGSGDSVEIIAGDEPATVMVMMATPLHEPIVWGGPIVMNTVGELRQAFREYEEGTFLKASLTHESTK